MRPASVRKQDERREREAYDPPAQCQGYIPVAPADTGYGYRVTSHADKDNARPVWAIVLMYGGEDVTAECLDSLLQQDYPRLTTLLVDNASPDEAGPRLRDRYPAIRFLSTGANLGYTGGNNLGMGFAIEHGAELLVVVNNDTVLDPRCISQLVLAMEAGERAGAVSPKILHYDDPSRIAFAGGDLSIMRAIGIHRRSGEVDHHDAAQRIEETTFVTGACFLTAAAIVRELGGFREEYFMYCEDVELSLRLRRAGYRLYYQPAARVLHHEKSERVLPGAAAAFHRDRNRRRMVREHYSARDRLIFALWFYPTRAVRILQHLGRGDWAGARAVARAVIAR